MISEGKLIKINIEDMAANYQETVHMDISQPCILILGGENTESSHVAYTYFKSIKDTLTNSQITSGLNLYSAYYNYGTGNNKRNNGFDRLSLFYEFRDPQQLAQMTGVSQSNMLSEYPLYGSYPHYIYDIYQMAIQPRLYAKNGELLSASEIAANLRQMIIYANCHGAYVVRMMEQQMLADSNLRGLLAKAPKLLKNLVVIHHEPFAPLENCQFTSLSFVSASDPQARLYTKLDEQLKSSPQECALAFLGPEYGNIVIADRLKRDLANEHSHIGLRGSDFTDAKLTRNGKTFFMIERNALISSVKAMMKKQPIPTIPQILNTPATNYTELKRAGMQIQRHFKSR